jgi:hypothetical protein
MAWKVSARAGKFNIGSLLAWNYAEHLRKPEKQTGYLKISISLNWSRIIKSLWNLWNMYIDILIFSSKSQTRKLSLFIFFNLKIIYGPETQKVQSIGKPVIRYLMFTWIFNNNCVFSDLCPHTETKIAFMAYDSISFSSLIVFAQSGESHQLWRFIYGNIAWLSKFLLIELRSWILSILHLTLIGLSVKMKFLRTFLMECQSERKRAAR